MRNDARALVLILQAGRRVALVVGLGMPDVLDGVVVLSMSEEIRYQIGTSVRDIKPTLGESLLIATLPT